MHALQNISDGHPFLASPTQPYYSSLESSPSFSSEEVVLLFRLLCFLLPLLRLILLLISLSVRRKFY